MRYLVEVVEYSTWFEQGSVLLPPGASWCEVEGALAGVGVYAPRGLDKLEWLDEELAIIRDHSGALMVRLLSVPSARAREAGG